MKNKKNLASSFTVVIVFLLVVFSLTWRGSQIHRPANINIVQVGNTQIMVDLAITPEQQEQGLSGRISLKEDEGMLFIFEKPATYVFWMKDMNFPIDMIWLGEDLRVVYIKRDARPELYPEAYSPERDAKYVLEVVSGFSDKNNIKEGDRVEFTY
ncbi:MAG TPA: DUF192 domain-containing protein [Candidatus Paceibacterota bacterium]|jgi:uncharacterized membrane protein (UPF0127 family)|nr:DUF192 domain-containing protein [Candidatus Paceibacterota bacterium]